VVAQPRRHGRAFRTPARATSRFVVLRALGMISRQTDSLPLHKP
jgi:hypothetical protein